MYDIRTARTEAEREAVFRFRYENHFRLFRGGYPGLDHAGCRVCEPHDPASVHTCAFDPDGRLVAVSTATPADAPDAPASWREWFALDRLAPLGLSRLVVSTRMVLGPALRGSGLFREFYRAVVGGYIRSGVLASLHYSRPGLVPRYESLGHRRYAQAFPLPGGEPRLPMIIAFNDPGYLARTSFPLAGECARETARRGFPGVAELRRVLPELGDAPPPAPAQNAPADKEHAPCGTPS